MDDRDARILVGRTEALLGGLDDAALEAVQALVALYGEGLARILAKVEAPLIEELAADELVSHLMLLHDLHPVGIEQRVREALEGVAPHLAAHGGGVELLGIEDGVARLVLRGHCDGCPSSAATLRLAVENAIRMAAPELQAIEAEGMVEPPSGAAPDATLVCPLPAKEAAA
jgi:Fe-S cluster biogenesis protein NfuA